jgi:predicted DNA-binding helix-hairpin-helix protein
MKEELLSAMLSVRRAIEQAPLFVKPPSVVTQFVVGPAGESDRELLTGANWLYQKMNLARAYYSAFRPVPNTPLENYSPTSITREHRLYQADWLLRFYGFQLNELPFDSEGALPTNVDPKLAWAREHLINNPIEINRASRAELLRIPGIGVQIAETILKIRRTHQLSDLSQLKKLGVSSNRAAAFILLNGKRPPRQLELF